MGMLSYVDGACASGGVSADGRMSKTHAKLDASWLAHRYQPDGDVFHFVAASRAARSNVAFLTDELLGELDRHVVSRAEAQAQAVGAGPLHFIFHSAYCCSTLLARSFDLPGLCSVAKEPQLLNDLVGWRHQGAPAEQVTATLDLSLSLLARPFVGDEAMVIKPSNVVNGLLPAMLTLRPEAKAILLYAPLPAYLASIARKGMWGRLWARELLSRQIVDGLFAPFGFTTRDHIVHTDLQAAAIGWLAQHKLFTEAARKWPGRVRTLDSEVLVAQPEQCLRGIADLFDVAVDDSRIAAVVASEFSRNAKDGAEFTDGQRARDQAASADVHREELEKVSVWAATVAETIKLDMQPPAPLLG